MWNINTRRLSPPKLRLTASLALVEEDEDGRGQGVWSGQQGEALKCCRELRVGGIRAEVGVSGASVLFLACGMGQ